MKARRLTRPAPWLELAWLAATVAIVSSTVVAAGEASGAAALAAMGATAVAGVCGLLSARARRAREDKLSADVTVLCERLLRLESRDVRGEDSSARAEALAGGVAADLDKLSGLVSSLADALSDQDDRIHALARAPAAGAAVPSPALAPALATRDDFARAAGAILRKLGQPRPYGGALVEQAAADALEAGRIELMLQGVVTLPQRLTRLYDAAARLRTDAGEPIPSSDVPGAMERLGRTARLEAHTLARVVTVARHLAGRDSGAKVMSAVSERSLADGLFVSGVEALLGADRAAAERTILRLPHHDLSNIGAAGAAALARFAALGAELACDNLAVLHVGWSHLQRLQVRYARVDAALLLEARQPGETSALVRGAAEAGIRIIATGIDREEMIPDLLDFDIPLAQGEAIGAIRPVRPEIIAAASDPPAGGDPPAARPPPVGDAAPASFRALLRRVG